MQVYRDLEILTARPSAPDMARVPHRLYGTVDGAVAFSVKSWLAAAEQELAGAAREAALPIFVGGTGLYFKTLTQGLSDIPDIPADRRAEVRAWAVDQPTADLHQELARRDPETASRLRPTDRQRIVRAIEVHATTGESLASFHASRSAPVLDIQNCLALVLEVDRGELRRRVDARFDAMIAAGALDEIRRLADRRLDPALPVMRAIGVPSLARYLVGEATCDEAISEAKTATRQYIKRQETFFRHQLKGFRPVTSTDAEALVASIAQS